MGEPDSAPATGTLNDDELNAVWRCANPPPLLPDVLIGAASGIHAASPFALMNVSWKPPPSTLIVSGDVLPPKPIDWPALGLIVMLYVAADSPTSWITTWSPLAAFGSSVIAIGAAADSLLM